MLAKPFYHMQTNIADPDEIARLKKRLMRAERRIAWLEAYAAQQMQQAQAAGEARLQIVSASALAESNWRASQQAQNEERRPPWS